MNPAEVVADRFEIQRLAGQGGMGFVYLATDRRSGSPVALKMLRGEADVEAIERFVIESRVLAQLSHPGIVRYVAHGRVAGQLFLAMEWLEGVTLAQHLVTTGVTIDESLAVVLQVACALGVAHRQGIVHRDVKPGNIFLVGGGVGQVKLLDFGIARLRARAGGVTQTGTVIGTPGYMAPEQARADRELDARADVFSLGCVLFRCLTGRNPFAGDDVMAVLVKILLEDAPRVSDLRPDVPGAISDLVGRMLAKQGAYRPADANAVGAELAELAASATASASTEVRTAQEGPSLTTDEKRVICVLLARPGAATGGALPGRAPQDAWYAAVAPHGGRLDLLADGSLLVTVDRTGTPADHAARCARCALALRRLAPDLPIALVAGEGVLRGRVPMGSVIDRGASLLALAEPGGPVRLDDVMAGFLGGRFDVRGEGDVLALLGEREESATTRTLLGKPSACVGRERDLATLESTWGECVDEPVARVVLVTAPAGGGKSRVRDELLARVATRTPGAEVWTGRGDPMSAGSPFGMLAEPIRRAAGVLPGEPPELSRQKLHARVGRAVAPADAQRVAEFLGELVGAPFPDAGRLELAAARADPQLLGDQMRRAWEDWLAAETSQRPVLLVLEDLHWGDLASVMFVDAALRHLAGSPFMVLALARPEVHALFPGLWTERGFTELRLAPLTRKACARLARAALGDAASAETIERVVERADGNAFFLEELIRAVAEGKGDALPGTVLAMVQARLEGLHVEERRLLRAASVFGKAFSTAGVMALLGGDDGPTFQHNWFADLTAKELIAQPVEARFRGELTFRHALVREAAYSMLTAVDRALGHRLAAAWLEREGASDAAVLAEHFERGGEPAKATAWYRRAAEQALGGDDLAAAIRWVERALEGGATGEEEGALRLIECEARRWRGENELGEAAATLAMRGLARGSAAWCDAASELALAAGALGHHHHLVALASELETVQPRGNHAQLVLALARLSRPLFWSGKHGLASRVLARAGALDQRIEGPRPTALASLYMARGLEARVLGDPSECLRWNELAVAESARAGDLRLGCMQRTNLGYSYLEIGANAEAERTLLDALASAERLQLPRMVATAQQNLGVALARRGALDEALRLERAAAAAFDAQGDLRMAGGTLIYLALIEVARGTLDDARGSAGRAVEVLANTPPLQCNALAVLAGIDLRCGATERAVGTARRASDLLASLGGIDEGESAVRLALAEALHGSGDEAGARIAIAAARARLLERAAKIRSEASRETFLRGIPENDRTLELARAWGV